MDSTLGDRTTSLPVGTNAVSSPIRVPIDFPVSQTRDTPRNVRARRDARGRYKSRGPRTRRNVTHTQQQRNYLKERFTLKGRLFEEYLHAFCVKGCHTDSVPAARSKGPVVEIFEAILKDQYRLGRPLRFSRMRDFYNDLGITRSENEVTRGAPEVPPSSSSFAGDNVGSRAVRHRRPKAMRYKGIRLPYISRRTTDMSQVKSWLRFAESMNAMKKTYEEALEIVRSKLDAYRTETTVNGTQTSSVTRTDRHSLCSSCSNPLSDSSTRRDRPSASDRPERIPSTPPDHAIHPHLEQQDSRETDHSNTMNTISEMAANDNIFLMISMLFDEDQDIEFGTFSRFFLEKHRSLGLEPTVLLKEVLQFAVGKKIGLDTSEHHQREQGLRATMKLFEASRLSEGKKAYKDMDWDFL